MTEHIVLSIVSERNEQLPYNQTSRTIQRAAAGDTLPSGNSYSGILR